MEAAITTFIRCTNRLSGILYRNSVPGGPYVRYPARPPSTPYSSEPTVTGVVHLYAIRGVVYGPDVRSEQEDPATVPRTVYVEHSLSHHHHAPRAAHSCESPAAPALPMVNLRSSGRMPYLSAFGVRKEPLRPFRPDKSTSHTDFRAPDRPSESCPFQTIRANPTHSVPAKTTRNSVPYQASTLLTSSKPSLLQSS